MSTPRADDKKFMKIAYEEAKKGYDEGGIPAEISALQTAGRLPASSYKNTTMYTTLSPCSMCTGAILLYKISRVVIGENRTFVGSEDWLGVKGVEFVVMDDEECRKLMERFIEERPGDWGEDIGEEGEER
ncbi:cytosine deaminase [Orbilia oligospora]|uniref:Cytosine deaminase n=1 Tax=Orbilia oligospora TaxID=2813651 RepID=A0A7C8JZF6_ORBOL|nr:cytosine deaminase [Orbilia oligospora]